MAEPLRDIHLPASVSWWPPAPGWVAVALVLLGLAGLLVYLHRRRHAPRRAALREWNQLAARYRHDGDAAALAAGLSRLLRRAALVRAERQRVAGLTGEAWLAFLDRAGGTDAFTAGPGRALAEAPYRPAPVPDGEALLACSHAWLRTVL